MPDQNSVIWITGASSGIGKAAALEFAGIGARVYASSRRHSILEMLRKEVEKENNKIEILPCNIESHQNVEQAAKKIFSESHLDCLINNAGLTSWKSAEENSIKEIEDVINTNLLGAIYCIKAVLPHMISNKKGTIINILSTAAEQVFTKSSAYAASKAGLLAYSNILREEVRKYNIRIINVLPGATATHMWSHEILKQHAEEMMQPQDVARVLVSVFLQDKQLVSEKIILKPVRGDL